MDITSVGPFRNDADQELISGGDYGAGIVATYVIDGCIAAGCHTLVMEDAGGDGMCAFDMGDDGVCDFGGTMSLTNSNGDVLAGFDVANSNFGSLATWEVCVTGSTTEGCEDEDNNNICDADDILGCLDSNACNFNPWATSENGDCEFATVGFNCDGTSQCLGDVNGNNVLEVADLLQLISEFGCLSGCSFDVSNDGAVTSVDLVIVLSGFGAACE